jgi:hypothetical protein
MKLLAIALAGLLAGCADFMAGYNHAKYGTPYPQPAYTATEEYIPDEDVEYPPPQYQAPQAPPAYQIPPYQAPRIGTIWNNGHPTTIIY